MLRVGELTERGMLTASIRPRNALRLKGLVPLLLGLARDRGRSRILDLQPAIRTAGPVRRAIYQYSAPVLGLLDRRTGNFSR